MSPLFSLVNEESLCSVSLCLFTHMLKINGHLNVWFLVANFAISLSFKHKEIFGISRCSFNFQK